MRGIVKITAAMFTFSLLALHNFKTYWAEYLCGGCVISDVSPNGARAVNLGVRPIMPHLRFPNGNVYLFRDDFSRHSPAVGSVHLSSQMSRIAACVHL